MGTIASWHIISVDCIFSSMRLVSADERITASRTSWIVFACPLPQLQSTTTAIVRQTVTPRLPLPACIARQCTDEKLAIRPTFRSTRLCSGRRRRSTVQCQQGASSPLPSPAFFPGVSSRHARRVYVWQQ